MTVKRVKLKEKSPDFVEAKTTTPVKHACDMPSCRAAGDFRAPKDRSLSDYYHFCETHIREYNAAWDFFSGMSQSDIEKHIRESMFGDRPTWVYTADPNLAETLRNKVHGFRNFGDDEAAKEKRRRIPADQSGSPEHDALALLGLELPTTFAKIRERYRTLMKTYHPDKNPGDKDAEELVKRINMAYTILKAAHEQYATLK